MNSKLARCYEVINLINDAPGHFDQLIHPADNTLCTPISLLLHRKHICFSKTEERFDSEKGSRFT